MKGSVCPNAHSSTIYNGKGMKATQESFNRQMDKDAIYTLIHIYISSVQSLSHIQLFAIPWTAVHEASLSIANYHSLLKLMSIKSVMPSNHLNLCRPLLLPPSILPSIRVFSSESVLLIRQPKYWSFSFSISPSNEHSGLISFRMDLLDLLAVQGTLKSLLQHHSSKASGTITAWQIEGEKVEGVTDFFFLGSKVSEDSYCSHEIRRRLFLGRKMMTT